jgi:glycosyltransferase involved in cell wall biosynthesis
MLPDALRSYRQQTWPARELLVVNDGAPLASLADDVHVVNLPDRGRPWTVGEKRNAGVRLARGVWLATWDDDDVHLPHRIEAQVGAAETWRADLVLADAAWIADDGLRVVGRCHRGRSHAVMASALVRRDLVVAAGGYPASNYREDAELLERVRYLIRGEVATMAGADWYVLRRHGDNVTLQAGESTDEYISCALRDPHAFDAQAAVDAVRAGPGGEDVVPA